MTRYLTRDCDCPVVTTGTGGKHPIECSHGNRYLTEAQLRPSERKPLRRVSEKRQEEFDSGERRNTGSTLKPGRGFAVAPAQQQVKQLACIVCGRDGPETTIDAAHVTPRRLAPHCNCLRGVVPLCRDCHERYDDLNDPFDLLPHLMDRGLLEETVHGFLEHGVSLRELLDVVTGERWVPESKFRELKARVIELEAGIAA
jgi:hypothetical protein